jgi:hypothetical protein
MKPLRSFRALFAALLLLVSAACSTEKAPPLAPAPAPELSLIGDLTGVIGGTLGTVTGTVDDVTGTLGKLLPPVQGLLECRVTQSYSTTQVVGRAGGTIRVGPHSLYIPANALESNTRITATAPKGNVVAIEFQPHGLTFSKKTQLTMSYRDCGLVGKLLPRIAYVDKDLNILEVLLTVPNVFRQTVTGTTDHFSSYMLAD